MSGMMIEGASSNAEMTAAGLFIAFL